MIKCLHCDKETVNPKFCNSSCSASYTNRTRPKRKLEGSCFTCHVPIRKSRKYCPKCFKKAKEPKDYTIGNLPGVKHKRSNYNLVRARARVLMNKSCKEKVCELCGFSEHVNVCHIKPISSYPDSTLVSEINHLSNLVYLCPNHHWMLDNGKLKLT